jgi:hypothetical protein
MDGRSLLTRSMTSGFSSEAGPSNWGVRALRKRLVPWPTPRWRLNARIPHGSPWLVIPAARGAGWYARGADGAAEREINKIPAARLSIEEPMFRAAGVSLQHRVPYPIHDGRRLGRSRIRCCERAPPAGGCRPLKVPDFGGGTEVTCPATDSRSRPDRRRQKALPRRRHAQDQRGAPTRRLQEYR